MFSLVVAVVIADSVLFNFLYKTDHCWEIFCDFILILLLLFSFFFLTDICEFTAVSKRDLNQLGKQVVGSG